MTWCWHQLNAFFLPWKSKQRLLQQLISYFDVGGVDSNVPSIHLGTRFLTYSTPPLHLLHVPSLSNVGAIVAWAATHAQSLSPGGGMPPIFVIFLSSLESSWSFFDIAICGGGTSPPKNSNPLRPISWPREGEITVVIPQMVDRRRSTHRWNGVRQKAWNGKNTWDYMVRSTTGLVLPPLKGKYFLFLAFYREILD